MSHSVMKISPMDRGALIGSVTKAAADPQIGYVDVDRSMAELIGELNKDGAIVRMDAVESALWSANMLSEAGSFEHPRGISFQVWMAEIAPRGMQYDMFYNYFRERE